MLFRPPPGLLYARLHRCTCTVHGTTTRLMLITRSEAGGYCRLAEHLHSAVPVLWTSLYRKCPRPAGAPCSARHGTDRNAVPTRAARGQYVGRAAYRLIGPMGYCRPHWGRWGPFSRFFRYVLQPCTGGPSYGAQSFVASTSIPYTHIRIPCTLCSPSTGTLHPVRHR